MTDDGGLGHLLEDPVVNAIREAARGLPCHLVGGVVRDRLAGLATRDFDVTVPGGAMAVAERLASTLGARLVPLGGDRFAAVRLVGRDFQIDLWDREGGSLADDLERRDFTVNSIALGLDGEVVDPLGGRADLSRRRLKANRESTFLEDPLRVLRMARFAGLGYRVDRHTADLARRAAGALGDVAPERVREELGAALAAPQGAAVVHWLAETGLYPALWTGPGELPAGLGVAARALERRLPEESSPRLAARARHAFLATRLASGSETPAALLQGLFRRGFLSRRERDAIGRLAAPYQLPRTDGERRRFLYEAGPDWELAVAVRTAVTPRGESTAWGRVAARLRELAAADPGVFDPEALLDGHEVQRLTGLSPGAELGARLAALRNAQIEGRVRSREEAIAFVLRPSSTAG